MKRINFTDTTITQKPYVTINNQNYEVQDGVYTGGTDLNANTFNTMQDNIEEEMNKNSNSIGDLATLKTAEKSNLVNAVNELQNKYAWKNLKSEAKYNEEVSFAGITFEEIYVEIALGETQIDRSINIITFIIPKGTLISTEKNFRNGFYYNTEVNGAVMLKATSTYVKFVDAYLNGTQRNIYANMDVWYR